MTPAQDMADQTRRSAIDIIDEALRAHLGSLAATAAALDVWNALRRKGHLATDVLVEELGGTHHAFDAWLHTRSDLGGAGTAEQINVYASKRLP